ncbi:hypothetical protein KC328_g99 [Hortaea werneckii]|nr:hypothetical protein KC328_g99 [Hortaea werneckii]
MDDEDVKFLAQLNEGKDEDGQERKGAEKLTLACSLLPISKVAETDLQALGRTKRKSTADAFHQSSVRQTRKTRGRDAQVAEKLKKLRLELEDGRQLLLMVNQREKLKSQQAQLERKKFRERHQLRKVKVDKQIVGEKGDDEELLVDQKPVTKPSKRQSEAAGNRPATIRLRSVGERAASVANAPDNDLPLLEDYVSEGAAFVQNTIEARKEQHKKWNQHWVDETKLPLTPPFEEEDPMLKWASFPPEDLLNSSYPTPPPSLPSRSSIEGEDVDMKDAPRPEAQIGAVGGAEREPEIFAIPGAWPESEDEHGLDPFPAVRLRIGRGGRRWLETRKRKPRGQLSSGVVSDDDSDDDYAPDYFPVPERITFEYRAALNNRPTARPEGPSSEQRQRQWSGDQQQGGANGHAHPQAQQAVASSPAKAGFNLHAFRLSSYPVFLLHSLCCLTQNRLLSSKYPPSNVVEQPQSIIRQLCAKLFASTVGDVVSIVKHTLLFKILQTVLDVILRLNIHHVVLAVILSRVPISPQHIGIGQSISAMGTIPLGRISVSSSSSSHSSLPGLGWSDSGFSRSKA